MVTNFKTSKHLVLCSAKDLKWQEGELKMTVFLNSIQHPSTIMWSWSHWSWWHPSTNKEECGTQPDTINMDIFRADSSVWFTVMLLSSRKICQITVVWCVFHYILKCYSGYSICKLPSKQIFLACSHLYLISLIPFGELGAETMHTVHLNTVLSVGTINS